MKNSLMPLALVLLTVCGAVLWLASSPTSDPGVEGPRLVPGIFRLPKDQRHMVQSAGLESSELRSELRSELQPSQVGSPLGDATTWTVVVVRAEDHRPMTNSVVLALAENLVQRGSVAVIAPDDEALLPLGAERVLAISSSDTSRLIDPTADTTVTVTVRDHLMRLPALHPAANRQPDALDELQTAGVAASVTHHSTVPANQKTTWSGRYAAIGRAIANVVLTTCGCPAVIKNSPQLADWGSLLHLPPQYDGAHWFGAFQSDLVRGWIGETTVETASMESRMKNGQWHQEPTLTLEWKSELLSQTSWSIWSKEQDGIMRWFCRRDKQIICWEERPGTIAVVEGWLNHAVSPDAQLRADATARLTRNRGCTVLPAELRARIATILDTKH